MAQYILMDLDLLDEISTLVKPVAKLQSLNFPSFKVL